MADRSPFWTAGELVEAFAGGTLTPVEALEACLEQVASHNATFNALCHIDEAGARASAEASAKRWRAGDVLGPLDGVPTVVKDLIPVAGMPLRYGSLSSDDAPVTQDAPSATHLRKSGAVILGKTCTAEHGWKAVTDSPLTGITRNPWNPDLTSGGSSGGSAVAVATGMAALALGGDEGGSIRVPASFCGVAGLKPTFGRVPLHQPAYCGDWSHVGPIARNVADLARAMTVLGRPDPRDWKSLPDDGRNYLDGLDAGVADLRIALSPGLGLIAVDPEIENSVRQAAAVLESLGAVVTAADPAIQDPYDDYYVLVRMAARAIVNSVPQDKRHLLDKPILKDAAEVDQHDAMDVKQAELNLGVFGAALAEFFTDYDLIVTATVAMKPFPAGMSSPPGRDPLDAGWTATLYPFDWSRQPAISVPCGLTSDNLPIGLQIAGPQQSDALVLRAARAFEAAFQGIGHPPI
jgi:aspartyl-tRNA(Asn)/glutamyl-tRNA(Gln) amidotransferase subunit A